MSENDILYDIEMQLYSEFNDTIATMNDHLGEIYSYKDVEDVKQAKQQRKIELMTSAIKQLQNNWNELKELLQKQINACDEYIKCYKDELQQRGARSNGKTYLQGEILKNQIAGLTFSLILADMKKKEGNDEGKSN